MFKSGWIYCFLFGIGVALSELCPVSQRYGIDQHFHRYPQTFYDPLVPRPLLAAFNCNTHIVNEANPSPDLISLCDRNVSLCPVKEENIRSALSIARWPQYVDALRYLGSRATINVFYFGGSMTHGSETFCRCRCRDTEDSRCPSFSVPAHLYSTYCSWPSHLTRWLNSTYPATTFHFHDYSAGGRNSGSSPYFVQLVHTSSGEANFSHPALFFLDYSVNDVYEQVFTPLETFVRTIYDNFGRHYNIRPTVVLLEQYAHGTFHKSTSNVSDLKYNPTYRRIARRYHLVLISLREVYWTYFGPPHGRNVNNPDVTKRYYPISPLDGNVHLPLHPPWYIHLFIADVVAECMKRIAVHFQGNSNSDFNVIHNLHNRTHAPTLSHVPPAPLPAPLFNHSTGLQQVCNISIPFILSAIPKPINIPADQLDWRKGWIEHVSHSTPGWEINNHSDPAARSLSFPLNRDTTRMNGAIVMVSYLRSYEGMGTATVHVCGAMVSTAQTMQGLALQHISVPTSRFEVFKESDIARCESLPAQERVLSIVYEPGTDKIEKRAKHDHLFKVFSVQVCTPVLAATH